MGRGTGCVYGGGGEGEVTLVKEGTHTRKKSQRSSSASMKLAVSMNHMRKVCRRP